MKYWFTADPHFGHSNIIKYTGRPYKNVTDMNSALIKNWNKRVSEEDIVYLLGDACFRNSKGGKKGEGLTYKPSHYLSELNGTIVIIMGNHDKNNGVKSLLQMAVIKYGPHYIHCVHDPKNYDPRFGINFVGHIHEKWKFKRVINPQDDTYTDLINVGVDQWNFQPVTFEEIFKQYKKWVKNGSKK